MNTKTDGISSGLVAVAWKVKSQDGFTRCILEREPSREDFDLGEEFIPFVRLSDAEAVISKQSAALKLAKDALMDWLTTDLDEQQCWQALAAINEVLGE